jgi:CheY-like chemotaxis protein
LKGLRVRIVTSDGTGSDTFSAADSSLGDICRDWLHMDVVTDETPSPGVPDIVLWSRHVPIELLGTVPELATCPHVVVCPTIQSAHHRNTELTSSSAPNRVDFISQPIGPRKLAKALSLAYRRPADPSIPNGTRLPLAIPRPKLAKSISSSLVPRRHTSMALSLPTHWKAREAPAHDSTLTISPDGPKQARSRTHCLLVDDNDINIKVLAAIMRKLQIEHHIARNGQEAVDKFGEDPSLYKCILMDISMPVMDGFEATRQVRALEAREHAAPVPVFALTGLSSDEAHREAFESGMDAFLTKPVKLVALKELLRSRGVI